MRFPAAVAAALVLAALPLPAAQAAGCVWTASGMPTHPHVRNERVTGISPDGSISVGHAINVDFNVLNGILWFGTTPSAMAEVLSGPGVDNVPFDVTDSGVVAGYAYDNNTDTSAAYRYHVQDGTYEWLQAPHHNGAASYINERGDVAGWLHEGNDGVTVVWPAGSTQPVVIGPGTPVGLDEAGRVVTTKGQIWSPDGKSVRIKDTRGARPWAFAGDHVVGSVGGDLIEWNLQGKVTRVIDGGAGSIEAVNATGLIVASHEIGDGHPNWAIWDENGPQDLRGAYIAGITDSGVAYGENGSGGATFRCV
ncbi:hypothetical protein ABZX92_34605 [Lentzea sp. NPDC006480]|uniref:hypothetical protein n=1 Tax=Lentzea sp. NPDC006480 TaxID=3157176 RepID=UPI0033B2ADCB